MASTFAGFPPETLQFLKTLKRNNDREWFPKNKARYESAFLAPSPAFIEAMQKPLEKIRFAKDKTPYKTNIGIQFRHEAGSSVHAPGFYLHVEPGNMFLGAGIWRPDRQPLLQIRRAVSESPSDWKRARDAKSFRSTFELSGDSLKRPPAGFEKEDLMIEDLKRKDFIGVCNFEDDEISDPKFLQEVARKFRGASPFMRFLCSSLELPF